MNFPPKVQHSKKQNNKLLKKLSNRTAFLSECKQSDYAKMSDKIDHDESVQVSKKPKISNWSEELAKKGYKFNHEGVLRQISNEAKGFEFEVKKGDHGFNQRNYEEIGEIITEHVYDLMESEPYNLVRREIPNDDQGL